MTISYKFKSLAKKFAVAITLLFLMVALIAFPDRYVKSSYDGILLYAITVLPSLLPFFFLTTLFTKTGALDGICKLLNKPMRLAFNSSGLSAYAFTMSILSGYPIGSRIICDLYSDGLIDKHEATRTSVLASTSGPLFVIGAVGIGMFESKTGGFVLYISHVLSAILTGLIFRFYGTPSKNNASIKHTSQSNILYDSIYSSVISVLLVGGFVCVFYVVSQILCDFNLLYPLEKLFYFLLKPLGISSNGAKAFTAGLIECTKGCKLLSADNCCPINFALSGAIVSFGGVSAIMQSIIYLKKANVRIRFFILGKIIQMTLCFLLSFLIFNLFY